MLATHIFNTPPSSCKQRSRSQVNYYSHLFFLFEPLEMKYLILVSVAASALLYTPAEAQTCPGVTGSCNCQLNNVESLRALIRTEVEEQVETEVAARLASTPGNMTTLIKINSGHRYLGLDSKHVCSFNNTSYPLKLPISFNITSPSIYISRLSLNYHIHAHTVIHIYTKRDTQCT